VRINIKIILTIYFGATVFITGVSLAADKIEIKNEADKINYSIGYQIGGDFKRQGWELNIDMLTQGIHDSTNRRDPLMTPEQMSKTLINLKKKLEADQQVAAKEIDAAFLVGNAKKEGVVVLPSGVQYKVLKDGTGKQPTLKDTVVIQYQVSRADGQKTVPINPDNRPKTYPLEKALPGLQETLQLMKEGSLWQIVLPPGPALGTRGEALERAGVLLYQLELLSVQDGK